MFATSSCAVTPLGRPVIPSCEGVRTLLQDAAFPFSKESPHLTISVLEKKGSFSTEMRLGKKPFCRQGGTKANLQCCRAWVSYTWGSQSTPQLAQHRDPVMHRHGHARVAAPGHGDRVGSTKHRASSIYLLITPSSFSQPTASLCFMARVILIAFVNLLSKVELNDF